MTSHPATEPTVSLDVIAAKLDRIEHGIAEANRLYLEESAIDYAAHLSRIFAPAWDEERPERITPDECNCPICWDTGQFEDEEGFVTDCPCTRR